MERLRQKTRDALQKQVGSQSNEEVESLFFTDSAAPTVEQVSSTVFPKLATLGFVALRPPLLTLDFVTGSAFASVRALTISENRLTALPADFAMPQLVRFLAVGNKFATLDAVAPLKNCPSLEVVDLFMNPVTEAVGYRDKMFQLVPTLQVLDDRTRDGTEVEAADDSDDSDGDDEEGEEEESSDDDSGESTDSDSDAVEQKAKQHRAE